MVSVKSTRTFSYAAIAVEVQRVGKGLHATQAEGGVCAVLTGRGTRVAFIKCFVVEVARWTGLETSVA